MMKNISTIVSNLIAAARAKGEKPDLVVVSPEGYTEWQRQSGGKEPFCFDGIAIAIRTDIPSTKVRLYGPPY